MPLAPGWKREGACGCPPTLSLSHALSLISSHAQWGTAILGPVYANATGPATSLSVPTPKSEPGVGKPGVTFYGTLTTTKLVVGKPYKMYRITSLTRVPVAPTRTLPAQDLYKSFNATSATRTDAVSFLSSTPAYFIVVAA